MSPLSSSIGGIKNLPREENLVGVDKCLLHQQRSSLSLSGAPGETASSQPPPQPPSCAQGPKGRARWEQSLKQHAGEGHGGTLAPGAAAPRSGGPCPSVCPTHRRPLGSWGYLHPLLSSQLRPDTCPRRQHPPTALSIRSALQGTLPRQRGDETYSQDLLQSGPPPLSGNF